MLISAVLRKIGFLILPVLVYSISFLSQAQTVAEVEDFVLVDSQWEQLVLPGNAAGRSVAELFGDELNTESYGTTWVLFTYDGGSNTYANPGIDGILNQSEAFWMTQITGADVALNVNLILEPPVLMSSASCTSTAGCTEADLAVPNGGSVWTMLGASQPADVPVDGVRLTKSVTGDACETGCTFTQAAAAGIIGSEFWRWNSASGQYDDLTNSASIPAWFGGWMNALPTGETAELQLQFPAPRIPGDLFPDSLIKPGDLLSLHYDHCPDPDDGHAAVAGKMMVDYFGLNTIVISGTCGYEILNLYAPEGELVMNITWGIGGWENAFSALSGTIQNAGTAWSAVLANDQDVWVAEGGPSDVTSDILRWINTNNPELDTSRIHVVQHARPFNEGNTIDANLAYVIANTDYTLVPNGNIGGNGSADLNMLSSAFVARALGSAYGDAWQAAFNYLNPAARLDFSDTVEILHIVGDDLTSNVDDFGDFYFQSQ